MDAEPNFYNRTLRHKGVIIRQMIVFKPTASIDAFYARVLVRHLTKDALETANLLAGTGLVLPSLWTQSEVKIESFKQLLSNAETLFEGIPVGFLLGQYHNTMALGPMGVAMGAAPNVREGLQILDSYTRLHASYIRAETNSGLRQMTLRLYFLEELGETQRHHLEATLMFFENYIENITGKKLEDACYKVAYSAPAYATDYTEYLHSTVEFDHPYYSIELPTHWLETPSPYFHEELWHQSLRQLSASVKELGKVDTAAYSKHLGALLRGYAPPFPGIAPIAERLHISMRTLNRRLEQEGTSFREIRNTVLDQCACQHLAETHESVEAISMVLGYQDTANFRRAFKTRMGMTPSEYRSQLV